MIYKNGNRSETGDVIRWNCWDNDDFTTWTFTGIVKSNYVIYLGGGIDFGSAIGSIKSFDEVIDESESNDGNDAGIEKIGVAKDLASYIRDFKS